MKKFIVWNCLEILIKIESKDHIKCCKEIFKRFPLLEKVGRLSRLGETYIVKVRVLGTKKEFVLHFVEDKELSEV